MAERSKELIMVGYFLSRFGKNSPPDRLNITKWKDTYNVFYDKLSEGRSVSQFEHSLKNSRDAFDGYFSDTEREGWKADDGSPSKLSGFSLEVYDQFEGLSEIEVFEKIKGFISPYVEKENNKPSRFFLLDLLNKVFNYSWLYDLSPNEWNQLLDNTSDVLEGLILDKNDKRLAISLRNDNIKGLSVIFGNKYVGGFYLDNGKALTRFFTSADFDVSKDDRFAEGDWQSKDSTSGKLMYCSPSDWEGKVDVRYNSIRSNLIELLALCGNSKYKRTHLPFMYDVILNLDVRSQFLNFVQLEPEQRLIEAYRQYLEITGNEQELYKWRIGKQFQDNWDLDAEDFGVMLKSVKLGNLISQQSGAFFREARKHPKDARTFFKYLFDESISISERITWARDKGTRLVKTWRPSWKSAGQDERTLSVIWSFNDLKNHIPYKSSFYNKYCALIDVKPEKPGKKYVHYLRLADSFIKNHLSKDKSLIELHNSFLDRNEHIEDPHNKLMAQNILYRILDDFWDPEKDEDEKKYIEVNELKNNMDINLKEQFADWFAIQDTKYFENLFNSDKKKFIEKLSQYELAYESDFSISIFSLVNQTLEQILKALNTNEIVAQGEMYTLSSKLGNHAPKAILGKRNYVRFIEELINKKSMESHKVKNNSYVLNTILYGPPGTGKTYNTINETIKIVDPVFYEQHKKNRDKLKERFKLLIIKEDNEDRGQIGFTTFHQSFSYEDFIEGIKPVEPKEGDAFLKYEIQEGVFKKICRLAEDSLNVNTLTPKNFVLIIDEINRGNVSSVFGELITLIEKDKRAGADEELSVTLPYSKETFSVPQNVYIIGTMNTADRSIEALDSALRRRFSFREMPPKPELIKTVGRLKSTKGKLGDIDVVKILETINNRIEKLIDKDHKIGHSYFLNISSKQDLKDTFRDKVIPLLEEYFFGDFGKISLVLGSSFISKESTDGIKFATSNDYDSSIANDLLERSVYEITSENNWDFKAIYE